MKISIFLFTTVLFFSSLTIAQPGTLDSGFGKNGVVITNFQEGRSRALSVALQEDGKIITAGGVGNYGNNRIDFALVRYLPNGKLDNSFGINGKVITDLGHSRTLVEEFVSVVIQQDGKIVAGGNSDSGYVLIRYKKNGIIDSSFGYNGIVVIGVGHQIALQPDDKIVMTFGNTSGKFPTKRYKKNGTPDSSFGKDGIVYTDLGVYNLDYPGLLATQPDGKIVVGGVAVNEVAGAACLVRYRNNGDLDSSFGINGKTLVKLEMSFYAHALALLPDGRIALTGYSITGNNFDFATIRFKKNGNVDSSFGTNGWIMSDFGYADQGGADIGESSISQPDGKILVAGEAGLGQSDNYFGLVRYTKNGKPDNSFGIEGKVISIWGYAISIALQKDGKMIVAGYTPDFKFAVVRYNGGSTNSFSKNNFLSDNSANRSSNIYLSPNPVKDILHIENLTSTVSKTISVFDNSGKVLLKAITPNNNYSFNVSQFAAGIYFVIINDNKKLTTLNL